MVHREWRAAFGFSASIVFTFLYFSFRASRSVKLAVSEGCHAGPLGYFGPTRIAGGSLAASLLLSVGARPLRL